MRRLCRRARLGGMTAFNSLSHAACRMRSASYPPSARQCSPWTKSRSSSARVASCCWPGVNRSSIGCPSKVTTAWSFVENPPRDLASALAAGPPRPPAASWCARTIEASRIDPTFSSNGVPRNSCFHQPRSAQFRNRLYTVFHGPKLTSRSRQGAPVVASHTTASMKLRFPRSDCGPRCCGIRGETADHCSSVKACRFTSTVDQNHPRRARALGDLGDLGGEN